MSNDGIPKTSYFILFSSTPAAVVKCAQACLTPIQPALDVKTKGIIAVATAHITQCPFCIDVHTKKAKTAGASETELAEAIFVAMAMSASASFAHAAIAMGSLEPEPKPAA